MGRVDNHTIPLGDEDRGENPIQLIETLAVLHTQGEERDTERKQKKNSPRY